MTGNCTGLYGGVVFGMPMKSDTLRSSQLEKIVQQRVSTGLPYEHCEREQPSRCGQVRQTCGCGPRIFARLA